MIKLYDYYHSTASYRVRIALNYKALNYEKIEIHLVKDGGVQYTDGYKAINPQALVPTLFDGQCALTQSIAIIEYLEECYPRPALLPKDRLHRAHVRQIAQMIVCDVHPLNNLRVLQYLKNELNVSKQMKLQWYHHWLQLGFEAIEKTLEKLPRTKNVCLGDDISLADVCLIPQLYNARRFNFPLKTFSLITKIERFCNGLHCFKEAMPQEIDQPKAKE